MSILKAAILGFSVADAVGVPAEFRSRKSLDDDPVLDMTGYGSHLQPEGTWSDDSSLTFCLMQSLVDCNGLELYDLAGKFKEWLHNGYWTPHGETFDVGIATREAICRLKDKSVKPEEAGGDGEFSNGNGSLMRILPLAFYLRNRTFEEKAAAVAQVSSITHRHPVSIIGCMIYVELAMRLAEGHDIESAIQAVSRTVRAQFGENEHMDRYKRIWSREFKSLDRMFIQSTGYVVHTLEAALWCLLTSASYEETVLKAVNLGEDTDTTAAVAGGLAGIVYGIDGIPSRWLERLAKQDDILELCSRFERLTGESAHVDHT